MGKNKKETDTKEPTWAEAFRKLLWIPIIIFTLFLIGFIYDVVHSGISLALIEAYLIHLFSYVAFFYILSVLYIRYSIKMAFVVLLLILVLFGFCASKGNVFADAIRSYIQSRIDLNFFVGFLTVAALLIAIVEIQSRDKRQK